LARAIVTTVAARAQTKPAQGRGGGRDSRGQRVPEGEGPATPRLGRLAETVTVRHKRSGARGGRGGAAQFGKHLQSLVTGEDRDRRSPQPVCCRPVLRKEFKPSSNTKMRILN
jgi:hypothetical protein